MARMSLSGDGRKQGPAKKSKTRSKACDTCGGGGVITHPGNGHGWVNLSCPSCGGSGKR